ncbi:MAG: hypothetical protein GX090_08895 [Firmicutes bacterium]|nr:hypothetical protein [Bacillota bacterium]
MLKLHYFLVTIKSYLTIHFSSPAKLNLFRRLTLFLKGFFGESSILYDFKNNNPKDYLSDYDRLKTRFINGDKNVVLHDKELFAFVFGSYLDIPKNLGYVWHGKLHLYGEEQNTVENLLNRIYGTSGVIIKPQTGGGGFFINHLRANEDGIFLNNQRIDMPGLKDFIAKLKAFVITEYVEQADYAKAIFPGSTNTIRLVTVIDPKTNKPFIPIAVHKFGTSKTMPADNFFQGGLSASIDLETGILGKAALFPGKARLEWHSHHPETGAPIEGVKVPNWKEIRDRMLYVASVFSSIKYIGWDIASTNDGFKVIEGNGFIDPHLIQVHRGLLRDPRLREFYKHYKVI